MAVPDPTIVFLISYRRIPLKRIASILPDHQTRVQRRAQWLAIFSASLQPSRELGQSISTGAAAEIASITSIRRDRVARGNGRVGPRWLQRQVVRGRGRCRSGGGWPLF